MSYAAWVIANHEFPPGTRTVLDVLEAAFSEPSRPRLVGAGLILFGVREMTEMSPELEEFIIDMHAMLTVERDWLFAKESKG